MEKITNISIPLVTLIVLCITVIFPCVSIAEEEMPVTVKTVARAESDIAIKKFHEKMGFGKLLHYRTPTPIDKQTVIRMNRDTLYSTVVLDLSKPAVITMPETNGRYMSMHVVNQDHYSYAEIKPGRYTLTRESVGSQYAYVIFRTFIDANDPQDVKAANKLQDQITVAGGGNGPLAVPNWNEKQLLTARDALNTLAKLGVSNKGAFGRKEEIDPINHLIFAAVGWGGLPLKNTFAVLGQVKKNDGTPHTLTVKDVPVNAFWSVIVYNAGGFIEENPQGVYSFNNVTAKANPDGSITINFGGCEDGRTNCLPIMEEWNYGIRMYEPRKEILDGSWTFPAIKEAN